MLQRLFSGTRVIVAAHYEEEIPPGHLGSLVSGIAQRVDARGSLDLILRLQPQTRRIVVIGGATFHFTVPAEIGPSSEDRKTSARDWTTRSQT